MLHVTAAALKLCNNSGSNPAQTFVVKTHVIRNPLNIQADWKQNQMRNVFTAALNPHKLHFYIFTALKKEPIVQKV